MPLYAGQAGAAEDWSLCAVPSIEYADIDVAGDAATRVEAQTVTGGDSDRLRLSGDVELTRAGQRLLADDVLLDQASDRIEAQGNVEFVDRNYRVKSPRIELDNRNGTGLFEQPEFELYDRHARGSAEEIEKIDDYRSRFRDLSYTSCDPGRLDWHLRAREMHIDDESGRGSATHATLYFKEVPFLYLPYFQFPVDDRRMTGVLTPSFGYSEDNGNNLTVPVYLNLAPNYDMTVTPAWFSRRGLQLNTENRYLFRSQRGQVDLSYLDDDDDFDDSRWYQRWRHYASLGYDVRADLLLADISDGDIFDDFNGIAPEYNDISHLERRVRLQRAGEVWSSALLWQDYETLDEDTAVADRPYNRLPRFTLAADPAPWSYDITTPLDLEMVEFDRDDSVTGKRYSLTTSALWRSSASWYFFEPELQLAVSSYDLDNNSGDNSIDRGLPTLGVDTGLIFERDAGSRGQWIQTLEPRLYFLHTPYDNQDEIPDFDTSLASSTYSNLFRNNRFIGGDRIGDASQVTLGIASRILDNQNGDELMQLRAGRIFYFKDRRVSLDGERETASKSDVISELDVWPNRRVRIAARLVYTEDDGDFDDRDLSVNYADNGYAANLGYYFDEDELEQALLSLVYPVNERWTVVAKAQRSLRFERTVENLLGFSYESCCWGLKILAGQSGDEDDDFADTDNSIYFELTLKGLSPVGQEIDSRLRRAIPGYQAEF